MCFQKHFKIHNILTIDVWIKNSEKYIYFVLSTYGVVIEVDNDYLLYLGNFEFGDLTRFDKKIVNKVDYCSFKIFLLF